MEQGGTSMMRLDKLLSHAGFGTRKEVKELLKQQRVSVNGSVFVKDKTQVNEVMDEICIDGEALMFAKEQFIMINKPVDVITATQDDVHQTIMDCIEVFVGNDMFPVGRLAIDTEGLVLICNDGKLAHRLLSPKHHVDKMYEVELDHPLSTEDIMQLKKGIDLSDFITQPAGVEVLDECHIHLTIQEGKFHQIKRMMHALDNEVLHLKRLRFGPLCLDKALAPGEWRYLTKTEIEALQNHKGGSI